MASTVKSKKLMAKYRKDEDDDNAYVNTEFTIKDTTCDENDQPYYDQLDNTDHDTNHQKAKPNEYSQWGDRKISTDEIYENNEQSVSGVLQQKEVIHLQSKLPIPNSSKGLNIRHYKIGIGILAVICVILLVSLIAVAVILSASSKCEGLGCLNNGICTVVGGYMKCECLEGFSGLRCEVTPCSSNPCLHTGECTFGLNASNYVCSCPPGYTGESCQDYTCDVENTNGINCFLDQDMFADHVDWIRINGSTPTPSTGPSSAAEGNYYFYFEAGTSGYGTRARLISRTMNIGK
ncbi:Hypothetical predicted protein [Mytilus galloprovincialis]|uniref:Uncharacterized protein n=1 Tax=Mytilus galloprovincialis TaxID=29158 RepID=A0A8B6D2S7_MYTGA|nr:Hypothetical predicted protein [Mytilus galloprovincialis]